MSSDDPLLLRDRWARLRYAVVGTLLMAPPKGGELKAALRELSKRSWMHPRTNEPVRFGYSTLEKWFYTARDTDDPVRALRERPRGTAGRTKSLSPIAIEALTVLYRANPNWNIRLLTDNLRVVLAEKEPGSRAPSYPSVRRLLKSRGMHRRPLPQRNTEAALATRERMETRETRSYEVEHVNALWHADFHDGSRHVLTKKGELIKPQLFGCIDDRSRLICHLQWYAGEGTEEFVHGLSQALQRRGLPRCVMSDNGPAMKGGELTEGLARLGVLHKYTLDYAPHQNAKKENFWGRIEARLMAMLQHEKPLTLDLLNRASQAWVEMEYVRAVHGETGETPLHRYLAGHNVGRECPSSDELRAAFRIQLRRKQRRSDGTVQLKSRRYEVPSCFRHIEKVTLRFARWDLSRVDMVDPETDTILCALTLLDKAANADGHRRTFDNVEPALAPAAPSGMAPLMKKLLADFAATGLPSPYLPTDIDPTPTHEE